MTSDEVLLAHFAKTEVGVDDFESEAWTQADSIRIENYWSGEPAPTSRHAEARMIWSNNTLTVSYRCNQREPLLVNPHPDLTKKKIGLWETDVCELFIAPGEQTPLRYLEYEVAPTGEWIDLVIDFTNGERQTDWDYFSGMKAAAKILNDEVLMAMQIPWSDLLPKPSVGDVWRGNLFRCIGLGNERYMSWRPTYTPQPLFHVPEAFGRIKFVAD